MWRTLFTQLKRIREEGSFVRHVSIASSWNSTIILTQFLLSPVITRIFDPAEYSVFAIYNSIVANVALFGHFKYSEAVVLADTETRRDNLIALAFSLICGVTLVSFMGMALWRDQLAAFLKAPIPPDFLFLIPLGVWLVCVVDLMITVNIRNKKIFINGLTGFTMNVSARLFNIAYGLLVVAQGSGLILGDLAGKTVGLLVITPFRSLWARWMQFRKVVSVAGMKEVAVRYKSFPLYFFPSTFIVYISGHLPVFFFQWKFGPATVGAYALASSMLEIFNRLIPYAIAPMVLQKINELRAESQELLTRQVYRLFSFLLLVGFAIFSITALLSGPAFSFVFGESWGTAGNFASILALFYCFNFVSVAIMEVYNVMERQKHLLAYSVVNILLRVLAISLIVYWELDPASGLLLFAGACALGSILQIIGIFTILRHKLFKVSVLLIVAFAVLVTIIMLRNFYF